MRCGVGSELPDGADAKLRGRLLPLFQDFQFFFSQEFCSLSSQAGLVKRTEQAEAESDHALAGVLQRRRNGV